MSLPHHPKASHVFFDVFNVLCFSGVYTTISLAVFLAGVSFLEPASVTRYPQSSMLLAWLVLRETVLVFFWVVVFVGRIFLGDKSSILKVKYAVFILMYCKCYNLKYEQIIFNIIIDHY